MYTLRLPPAHKSIFQQSMFAMTLRDSALGARIKEECERNMQKKLAKKPWIADHRSC